MTNNEQNSRIFLPEERDKHDLIGVFNYQMNKIQKNLILFYDEKVARSIYLGGFDHLETDLDKSIDNNIGREMYMITFLEVSSVYLRDGIINNDPFKNNLLLSKGKFTEIGKDIILHILPDIITENYVTDEIHRKQIKKDICKKYNISSLEYYSESIKARCEMKKVLNKQKKVMKKELTTN